MPSLEELRNEIVNLQERALFVAELANCLPDHQDWLWRAEDRLRREAERLNRVLADQESGHHRRLRKAGLRRNSRLCLHPTSHAMDAQWPQ